MRLLQSFQRILQGPIQEVKRRVPIREAQQEKEKGHATTNLKLYRIYFWTPKLIHRSKIATNHCNDNDSPFSQIYETR